MKKRLLNGLMVLSTISICAQEFQTDSTKIHQLDEVVVTDSRFPLKRQHSGKNVILITSDDIKNNQSRNLAEIINTKSGIEINGSRSNAGQNLSSYIRGGNNRQVLILIDGIPISDASQISNDYDLKLIDINQIERVEISKGAGSTLYGNAAATAVINIQTKQAAHKTVQGYFSTSVGTNQNSEDQNNDLKDVQNSLGVHGSLKQFSYGFYASQMYLGGLSAVADGEEKDEFVKQNASLKLGYDTDRFRFDASVAIDAFSADFDNSFPLEDANFLTESQQVRIALAPQLKYKGGVLKLNTAFYESQRDIHSSYPANYRSKSWVGDLFNKYSIRPNLHSIVGITYRKNEVDFNNGVWDETIDPYVNVVWNLDMGLNLNVGARLNHHNAYGSHLTYAINPSYHFSLQEAYLKVLASYSTAFIAPSLSQLYGPFGANPNLNPETNRTLEAGLAFHSKNFTLSGLFFHRNESDFIDYITIDPVTYEAEYQNVDADFEVEGIEVELGYNGIRNLQFNANYTYTDKPEKNLRIPSHKANAGVDYSLGEKHHLGARFQYVSSRTDTDFVSYQNVDLEGFSTVDFLYDFQIIPERLNLSFSVNNLLNEAYNELVGYSSLGRNYRLGLTIDF